jgi:hypothetical protein
VTRIGSAVARNGESVSQSQFPVTRAVVNDFSPDGRLSKSFAAARCLEATQGESSLLELHAGGEPR